MYLMLKEFADDQLRGTDLFSVGLNHAAGSYDHWLLLIALSMGVGRFGALVSYSCAFSIANFVAMGVATYTRASFSQNFSDLLVGIVVVYLSLMNLRRLESSDRRRISLFALMIFVGAFHGFGLTTSDRLLHSEFGDSIFSAIAFATGFMMFQLLILLVLRKVVDVRQKERSISDLKMIGNLSVLAGGILLAAIGLAQWECERMGLMCFASI